MPGLGRHQADHLLSHNALPPSPRRSGRRRGAQPDFTHQKQVFLQCIWTPSKAPGRSDCTMFQILKNKMFSNGNIRVSRPLSRLLA